MNVLAGCSAVILISAASLIAQQSAPAPTTAADAASRDTSYIDAEGTAHITRVIPLPGTVSPEAQKFLSRKHRVARIENSQAEMGDALL